MDRRKFLYSGGASLAALTLLPLIPFPQPRNDTPMIQRLIDQGRTITTGYYVLWTPVVLRDNQMFDGNYSVFNVTGGMGIDIAKGAQSVTIRNVNLEWPPEYTGTVGIFRQL